MLVAGVRVHDWNLFELQIAGGYLIGVSFPVAFVQAFEKVPSVRALLLWVKRKLFGSYYKGYESFPFPTRFSFKRIKELFWTSSDAATYGTSNLITTFEDPLYLPEMYKRWDQQKISSSKIMLPS